MFLDCSFALALNLPAKYAGIAVADFDGDGLFELLIANRNGPNRILKWLGGALRDLVQLQLADANRPTLGAIAADFDGDGREEIYFLSGVPHGDRLLDSQLDGVWIDLFQHPKQAHTWNAIPGRAAAAIDRRGHGRYSLTIASAGHPLRLYELSATDLLADLAGPLGMQLSSSGRAIAVGPMVSGRSDIFCTNGPGSNFLFRNTGLGTFLEVAAEHNLHDDEEQSAGATLLDADREGKFDVCFGTVDGPHRLMTVRDGGRYRSIATPSMAMPSDLRCAIAADFDNDGFEELFFANFLEANRLFRRSPHRPDEWQMADPGPALASDFPNVAAAVADIDRDGRLELLIANDDPIRPALHLFKCPANDNHWIRVRPLTRFGAPARGAIVRLMTPGRTQVRVIGGGSSMEPVAHFGLGECAAVERITVTWPDDTAMAILQPEIRRTLVVNYPGSG